MTEPICYCGDTLSAHRAAPQGFNHGFVEQFIPDTEPSFVEPDCWGLDSYEHSKGQCQHQLAEESLPTPEQVQFARSWGYDL